MLTREQFEKDRRYYESSWKNGIDHITFINGPYKEETISVTGDYFSASDRRVKERLRKFEHSWDMSLE